MGHVITNCVGSSYTSYVLIEAFLPWHCIRGNTRSPGEMFGSTMDANEVVWGPFHASGILGLTLQCFCCQL